MYSQTFNYSKHRQKSPRTQCIYELQYTDDAALPSHSPSGLQDDSNTRGFLSQSRLDPRYQENRFCNHHLPCSSHSQYMAIRST